MTQLQFDGLTASTPTDIFVADTSGNNKIYLGQITSAIPPAFFQNVPSLFDGLNSIMLIMSASNGCQKFKIIPCS
jgi:hypothetical protein